MATWDVSSTWILEILSAGLSAVSLAALIGVLIYTDGRELVAWHNLTLNTVISILSTISRLCAIFVLGEAIAQVKWAIFSKNARSLLDFEAIDAASRGPVGAFWLLFRKKKIAIVGAAAILLALAFDPFAQQLVRLLPEVDYSINPNATLPHALSYSKGNRVATAAVAGLQRGGMRVVTANADFAMQSAVFYGLTQSLSDVSQQLPAKCSTGNCTWPISESLAVCSTCNDVSTALISSSKTGMSIAALMDTSNAGSSFGKVTKFQLPNGLSIDNYEDVPPELLLTSLGTGNESRTVSMTDIETLIWSMTMLRVSPSNQSDSRNWPAVPLEATECALYYCVKRYESSITSNDINSTSTVITSATRDLDSWQPVSSSVEQYQANLADSDIRSLAFDKSLSAVERTDLRLGTAYNVSQAAINGVSSFFQETFAAENISNVNNTNGFYMSSSANAQYSPSAIQPLVASSNLTDTFAAVAESMSNAIRASDINNTEIGLVGTTVTRYVVHWPWIALPIFVVFASIAQLIITIHYSKNTPLWKNASLAVMSRGRYVSDLLGEEANTVTAMQEAVGKQRVQLFPGLPVMEKARGDASASASASAVELTRYPSAFSSNGPTRLATPVDEDMPMPVQHPLSKI